MSHDAIVFTTFDARHVGSHAGAMVESCCEYWPFPLVCYTDSTTVDARARCVGLPALLDIPDPPDERPGWLWDVRRFLWKASAIVNVVNAAEHRYVFWLDADVFTFKPIPAEFLIGLLDGHGIAYLGRNHAATESGLLAFDRRRDDVHVWCEKYRLIYESGGVYGLKGWADTHVFDEALRVSGVSARNLTPDATGFRHVWCESPLAAYMDHAKGARKFQGYSPEHPLQDGKPWRQ